MYENEDVMACSTMKGGGGWGKKRLDLCQNAMGVLFTYSMTAEAMCDDIKGAAGLFISSI